MMPTVDFKDVAEYLRQEHPRQVEAIVREADDARGGRLVLPGTQARPYFTGTPPRWHDNPVRDDEYVWVLNRMFHWKTLLQAFALTGDRSFAERVLMELDDWLRQCPVPALSSDPGILRSSFNAATPWRSLEAGIRMYDAWPWMLDFLGHAGLLTPELRVRLAKAFRTHGRVLRHVCPVFFPNADHNHYFMEMLGLLHVAGAFPGLPESDEWRGFALRELARCTAAQFTTEGGQLEGCPHYHNLCVCLLRRIFTAAARYGFEVPPECPGHARRAVDYALHASRPSGTIVPWGDSDADETHVRAALDGFLMLGDRRWLDILLNQGLAENVRHVLLGSIWEVPEAARLLREPAFLRPAAPDLPPRAAWFKALDQATMRTGWNRGASSVFFACRKPANGHAHIDPMGFDFTALGKPLLVDPGRFCYREDADRRDFKSAAWHNTLCINGRDPFEYISSWEFGPQAHACITGMHQGPGYAAVMAEHHNYAPVIHRRMLVLFDGCLLIVDWLNNLRASDTLDWFFHFDTTRLEVADGVARTQQPGANLLLVFPGALVPGCLSGAVSDFLDVKRPSTRLHLRGTGFADTHACAFSCLPFQTSPPEIPCIRLRTGDNSVECTVRHGARRHAFVWTGGSLVEN